MEPGNAGIFHSPGKVLMGGAGMLTLIGLVMDPAQSLAQTAAVAAPKFELASIRRCDDDAGGRGGRTGGGGVHVTPGRLNANCMPIMFLITDAYVTYAKDPIRPGESVPISGGPAWLKSDRYDIEAKAEGNPSAQMMEGPMLQALLEDRLKLRIHHETKEIPVYELIVAKTGFKLHPMAEGSCTVFDPIKSLDLTRPLSQNCGLTRYGSPKAGKPAFVEYHGMSLDEVSANLIQDWTGR